MRRQSKDKQRQQETLRIQNYVPGRQNTLGGQQTEFLLRQNDREDRAKSMGRQNFDTRRQKESPRRNNFVENLTGRQRRRQMSPTRRRMRVFGRGAGCVSVCTAEWAIACLLIGCLVSHVPIEPKKSIVSIATT
mgnify:CR=1 FL=1